MRDQQTSSQRLDRWLWYARLFKTRSLAGKSITESGVRLTRDGRTQRTTKASFAVRLGDTIALMKGARLMVVEVMGLGTRRGPAPEARNLYKDHSPPLPPRQTRTPAPFARDEGAGRPTKKDRRALEALRDQTES